MWSFFDDLGRYQVLTFWNHCNVAVASCFNLFQIASIFNFPSYVSWYFFWSNHSTKKNIWTLKKVIHPRTKTSGIFWEFLRIHHKGLAFKVVPKGITYDESLIPFAFRLSLIIFSIILWFNTFVFRSQGPPHEGKFSPWSHPPDKLDAHFFEKTNQSIRFSWKSIILLRNYI